MSMKRSIYASEIADHDRSDAPTFDPFGSWRASIGLWLALAACVTENWREHQTSSRDAVDRSADKRYGDTATQCRWIATELSSYLDRGSIPDALSWFCILISWSSPAQDRESPHRRRASRSKGATHAKAPRKDRERKQRRSRMYIIWCTAARYWRNKLVERPKMTNLQFIPVVLDRKGLLSALRAFKRGDFSVRLPMDLIGIDGEIAQAFNDVVEVNEKVTDEFARIRDEVGREGQINQRVKLPAATGSWADCVDSVNTLIGDLVRPTAEMARVIESVARGDLSQRMLPEIDGRPLRGEFLRIGKVVNTMVDQLGGFASEVSRVAREVGTDGKLGGQAQVPGVAGTWKDLTDNVNSMAANLTGQVRNIAEVTTAVAKGDLSKKITVDVKGEILELKSTINTMVDELGGFASEVSRVVREVGSDGKLGGQATVQGIGGVWKDLTDSVNQMASNLTGQVRNIAEVTTGLAKGDLSRKITVDVRGEILELKNTINTMVDQLNSFASEVTRVAREVGSEGKLGGQATVVGVGGVWKDLTDSVNQMASNLTGQVRNIAEVTTAVAKGDLSRKITVDVKGEILELKKTINTMVDQLNSFASEVTRVAL